jgi:hypothetical protein
MRIETLFAIMFTLITLTNGCMSDTNIRRVPEIVEESDGSILVIDVNPANPPESDDDPLNDEEEPTPSDDHEDAEPPPSCDHYFEMPYGFSDTVLTRSFVIYSVIGSSEIEVEQDETASFYFGVTAYECGDIDLSHLFIYAEDVDTPEWMPAVTDAEIPMQLELTSGSANIGTYTSFTHLYAPNSDELHYSWNDGRVVSSVNNATDNFPGYVVEAGTTAVFRFDFMATSFAQVGTTFTLNLSEGFWIDVETGESVIDWWSAYGTGITVTVI